MRVAELTFEEFLASESLWNDALQRSIDNNPFLTWEWLSNWWKHFGDQREFRLITIMEDGKILRRPMMCSLYKVWMLKLRKIEFIATPASDYHAFLLTERNPEHVRMMIKYACQEIPLWDSVELGEIPENSGTADILMGLGEGFGFKQRVQNVCPYSILPSRFEVFFQGLNAHFRKNLRRSERKLKKEHQVDFKICRDIDEVKNGMKIFFGLHQKRWSSKKKPGALWAPGCRNFHLDVAQTFAEKGWLALSYITLEDVPVVSIYGFNYRQKLYFYLSGFDPEYAMYSVGDLQQMYLIKHSIDAGLKEFDFMRGDEPYKGKWNTMARKNLEFWITKKRIAPLLYDRVSKDRRFSSLAAFLGKHVSSV